MADGLFSFWIQSSIESQTLRNIKMLHTLEPKRILRLAFTYCKHSSQSDDWLDNSDNTLIWTRQTNQASGWRTAKNWSTLETTFRNNRYRVLIIYLHCCWMKKNKWWARDGKANLDARMSRSYWTKKSHVKSPKEERPIAGYFWAIGRARQGPQITQDVLYLLQTKQNTMQIDSQKCLQRNLENSLVFLFTLI